MSNFEKFWFYFIVTVMLAVGVSVADHMDDGETVGLALTEVFR